MEATQATIDYKQLSVSERLRLIEEIWDSIVAENPVIEPTEAQKRELDKRLAEHEANPHDVVRWEDVRSEFLDEE